MNEWWVGWTYGVMNKRLATRKITMRYISYSNLGKLVRKQSSFAGVPMEPFETLCSITKTCSTGANIWRSFWVPLGWDLQQCLQTCLLEPGSFCCRKQPACRGNSHRLEAPETTTKLCSFRSCFRLIKGSIKPDLSDLRNCSWVIFFRPLVLQSLLNSMNAMTTGNHYLLLLSSELSNLI